MANHQTKLADEINEQIPGFTAGKENETTPYQIRNENNDFELNEVKRLIVHLIREIREERAASRKETKDLQDCIREIKEELATSRKETKDLREGINEIKEEICYLRNKLPESKFQFYPQSPTNNRKDNSQDDTGKSKEGNRENTEVLTVSKFSVDNFLSNSEFPLPLFDENSINPVLHLNQLDNYRIFR
jgi:uncharacterized coiled-coil DUF342 family protein